MPKATDTSSEFYFESAIQWFRTISKKLMNPGIVLVQTSSIVVPVPHTRFVSAGCCFHASRGTARCNQAQFMAANQPFSGDQD